MKFLQIDHTKMQCYEYSKEAQEGFEQHTSTKGNVTYRKYYSSGITGSYLGTIRRSTDFGDKININVNVEGDTWVITIDTYDQKNNFSRRAEEFIVFLPNLKVGETYRFLPYKIEKKEGEKYDTVGMSICIMDKVSGEKVSKVEKAFFYTKKGEAPKENSIPSLVWEKKRGGKELPSAVSVEAKNDFFYAILEKYSDEKTPSERQEPEPSQPPTQAPIPSSKTEEDFPAPSDDDLPF